MGRRHSIAAKKAAGDNAKSKAYSILSKVIQMAAKKWADPKMNPSLEMALLKARYAGVPKDIIDRAILKGSGQLEWDNLEEVVYEGYGPGGTAILIKTLTSNKNRTSSSIRVLLSKWGGNMAEAGAVGWQFKEKGIIVIDGLKNIFQDKGKTVEQITPFDDSKIEEDIIELPVDDFSLEDGKAVVYTSMVNFITTREWLEKAGYHIIEADIHYIADNEIALGEEEQKQLENVISLLEDDEDVDTVYHNAK
jgi:YebC/PmpR family DNA-binding regulatory protein